MGSHSAVLRASMVSEEVCTRVDVDLTCSRPHVGAWYIPNQDMNLLLNSQAWIVMILNHVVNRRHQVKKKKVFMS